MYWKKISVMLLVCSLLHPAKAQVIKPATRPNATQQALLQRGYGMFIHFGINTFADVEWSDGTIPAARYQPDQLNPDQWVRIARDAGFRYVLLTVKHHDGFCLWDSRYTDYDVAASPVKTDVVKAVSDACKKYGLQFAIYYSLWDRHEASYKDHRAYADYMLHQLTELFTGYGTIAELWLDGGWDKKPADWYLPEIYQLVKKYSPHCAVSVNHTIVNEEDKRNYTVPGDMTTDNQYFFQYFPADFRLWDPRLANLADKKQYLHEGQSYYLPFEHTICLSKRWNWFEKSVEIPTRDLDELEELFYWCTSNQNTLVINVPPSSTGLIRDYQANAVIALGKRLGLKKSRALPQNTKRISLLQPATASSNYPDASNRYTASAINDGNMETRWASADTVAQVEMVLNDREPFDRISIFEYQDVKNDPDGFSQWRIPRIQAYSLAVYNNKEWKTIYVSDEPIGDCRVIRFPRSYQGERLRLSVTRASAPPSIYEWNVYHAKEQQQR
ncbi:MAG: alpha-L-fucosidase [Sphingobacteriales bacterium]|nr:alpha-L-fucosidase [Sphingobacteriales bacterium]OJW34151.1 MAG: crotonobetainyl-CoA--carnitine CoA-transferase [Sphingobacteriales bacterium 46-32]